VGNPRSRPEASQSRLGVPVLKGWPVLFPNENEVPVKNPKIHHFAFSCVSGRISYKNTADCVYLPRTGGLKRIVTGDYALDLFVFSAYESKKAHFSFARTMARSSQRRTCGSGWRKWAQ